MNKPFKNIMLVTNEPSNAAGAEETAINIAKADGAKVLLIDSIKTPFQSRFPQLSTELMYEAALGAKEAYLKKVQHRFLEAGIESQFRVLLGPRTSAELIATVVKEDCDLVIRYMKGQSSRADGRFGATAENLMRACPVPVLFTEHEIKGPKVVACINLEHGPEENQTILESARRLVESPDDLNVVSCWEFLGNEFAIEYMDEGMLEQTKEDSEELFSKMFQRFCTESSLGDLEDRSHLVNANPVTAIPQFCTDNKIDIAVMCSASLNHPLGRNLGTTIERTIGSLPCGLLAVKPTGFSTAKCRPRMDAAQIA